MINKTGTSPLWYSSNPQPQSYHEKKKLENANCMTFYKYLSRTLKNVKVMKHKERLRNCQIRGHRGYMMTKYNMVLWIAS